MPKKKKSIPRKDKWFKPVRGSYLPNNTAGWLTYIPFVGYLIVSDIFTSKLVIEEWKKFYLIAVQWLFATLVMTFLAQRKS
jgi:branched-subunit amino acid transport protein